jgi:hypothetical protein
VTGAAATTADYTATYTQTQITPTSLGSFDAGQFTFTNLGLNSTQDTEVFIYNSNFQPVPGALNDDALDTANGGPPIPPGSSTLNSFLQLNLDPGTYYVLISNFNTGDNQASPASEGTASGNVMDFAGAMANASTTVLASIPFRISHVGGNFDFIATKPGPYDVFIGQITVVPEPSTMALCGLAAAGFAAIRRRRKQAA